MAIRTLTAEEYEQELAGEQSLFLLDFWREDCGPCKAVALELEQLAKEHPEVRVYGVNVEEAPELVSKFRVMTAPTLLVIRDGVTKKKTIGFKSKEHILELIEAAREA